MRKVSCIYSTNKFINNLRLSEFKVSVIAMTMNLPVYLNQYLPIVVFLGVAITLAILMVAIPFIVSLRRPDKEKLSAYECGFESFGDARERFDIRFYLVSILFIIFDLEIAFLFPWAITLKKIGVFGYWSMMFFLFILTVGFIYEWIKGGLDWE